MSDSEIENVSPGISRLIAPNPGPGRHRGTNTYLVRDDDGVTVIDPGPAIEEHAEAVAAACPAGIARILVTHAHRDHFGGVAALTALRAAPVYGYAANADASFVPDHRLADGERVGQFTALFTPGHAPDHLCFALPEGIVFSGDTVMGWASTMVSPPLGSMADYIGSLERLATRDDRLMLPGHGPPIDAPRARVRHLLERRLQREADLVAALAAPGSVEDLVERLYGGLDPDLKPFAARTLRAHLLKLAAEARAVDEDGTWRLAPG